MDDKQYQLRYLPLFYEDMAEVVDYISNDLQNPDAALELIDLTEQAILKRRDHPLSFQPIRSKRERKYPYYRINVNHYAVFLSLLTTSWRSDDSCTAEGMYNQSYNSSKRFAGAAFVFA